MPKAGREWSRKGYPATFETRVQTFIQPFLGAHEAPASLGSRARSQSAAESCNARLGGQTPAPRRRRAFITLQGMRPDSSLPCIALVVARYRTCWTDSTGKKKREAGAPFPRAPSQVAGARGEWRAG
jgi:hypothetical protein